MCHPKSRRRCCYSFNRTIDGKNILVFDSEDKSKPGIVLEPHEMCGLIKDIKDGKWDKYYEKYLREVSTEV